MPPLPQLKQMMVQPKAALLDGVEPLSQMSVNTSYELQAKGASDEPLPPSERPEDSSGSVAAAEPHGAATLDLEPGNAEGSAASIQAAAAWYIYGDLYI